MAPRAKRSRLVFDEISQDWVPRWGPKSIKKIEDKHQWAMLEKPKHAASGIDPFTFEKAEKRAVIEKQNLRHLKNKMHANGEANKGDVKILGATANGKAAAPGEGPSMKLKENKEKQNIRKREMKSLTKSLQTAQMSTASMGKFDKKAGKNEPDAPGSQKVKKKKSNAALDRLGSHRGEEKSRNMNIFDKILKGQDLANMAGKSNSGSKSLGNANIADDKLARKAKKKDDSKRHKIYSGKK